VAARDRLVVFHVGYTGDGDHHVSARFGSMEDPNMPDLIRLVAESDLRARSRDVVTYFLSTIESVSAPAPE
jgi:KUP system potassium uptake protein